MKKLFVVLGLLLSPMFVYAQSAMEKASIEVDEEMMEADSNSDPYESINRKVFVFNNTLDKYALKPVAQAYDFITPDIVNQGISNVFSNLGEVNTTFNSLLQGKFKNSGLSMTRLLVNSTFGVVGIFDVASNLGVTVSKENFGQTLGVWGLKKGPYLMLPFLGSSTPRQLAGVPVSWYLYPLSYAKAHQVRESGYIIDLIDVRADLLDSEKLIIGDRYTFIRDYYLNKVQQDTHGMDDTVPESDDFVE